MRPLGIAAIGAAAGAIALAALFPRLDPAAIHATPVARADAIRRAGEWSAKLGVPTSGWQAAASMIEDGKLNRYRRAYAEDPAGRLLTPLSWGVVFTKPGGAERVRVMLAADGRLVEWESSAPGTAASPAEVFAQFAGGAAGIFRSDASGADPAWERPATPQWPLGLRVQSARRDGRLVGVTIKTSYDVPLATSDALTVLRFLFGILVIGGVIAALVTFILAWRRGAFTWRLPAAMALVIAAWLAIEITGGTARQDYLYARGAKAISRAGGASFSGSDISGYAGAVGFPLLLFLFAGAGYGLTRNRYRGKWTSIELAARGQLARKQVCAPLAAGILAGVAIAAIPYVVASLSRAPLTIAFAEALGAPLPDTVLFNFRAIATAVAIFGFGLPVALRLRNRWVRFAAAAVVLAAFAIGMANRFDAALPGLIHGTATAAICLWLFAEFDVLAASAAIAAARAVVPPCILLSQHAAAYRDDGIRALFLIAAAGAAAIYFALRGRDADAADEAALRGFDDMEGATRSSRERLQAEFEVARKAQQDALSAIPGPTAGFTFDAICEPAQQVGGDLYDFFPLPDGRLGAAVADVSGKGVPAALYMMVTKGLIGAAVQDSGDLRHILQSLNLHLHRACKRKVFVTMAAVALDPERRRVEYGRAGHNPIVWRRARRGETVLVKPRGVGLGMCGAEPFARSLRLEEFELEPGDAIVLYSDGVTEAVNPSMDQFGEDRLMRAIEAADGGPAAAIRGAILRDLAAFAAGAPARDDVTVVAIRAPG